jgi:glycosyltransferase involved in cell wall biosynthesis
MTGTKPKVLIFLNRLVIGGPAIDVISMAGFLQADFDILIIYGEKEPDEVDAKYLLEQYPSLNTKKVESLKKSFNPISNLVVFFDVVRLIKSFKPDIIHTHGALPGVLGRLAAAYCNVQIKVHTFHGHFFHSYLNTFFSSGIIYLEKILASITTSIIATSKSQTYDLVSKYKIAPLSKVATIQLGIDEGFLSGYESGNNSAFAQKYILDSDTICVGIIARIVKVKNFNLFVEVVDIFLKKTKSKVVFFVIGDGYLKKDIQKLFTEKAIAWSDETHIVENPSVIFTSWVSKIGEALSMLDIVLLTSNNEGTGLSLAESQYCGKPVVSTNVGGVADTVIDGITGFLVPPLDSVVFTEKLLLLTESKELRQKMGNAAKIFAHEKFSKETEVATVKKLYTELIKNKSK